MDIKDPANELRTLLEGILFINEFLAHSKYDEKEIKSALKRVKKEFKRMENEKTEKSIYLSEEAKDLYD